MLIVTIHVDAPVGQAISVKEHLAMELEKFGDVRGVEIREETILGEARRCRENRHSQR